MPYPSLDLYPSDVLFPGIPLAVSGNYIECSINDLILTASDDQNVKWIASTLTGWWGSSASSLQLTQKTRGPGAWAGPRQMQSKVLTVAGTTIAPSVGALRDAMDRLNAAVSLNATLLTVKEDDLVRSCIVYRQDEVLWTRMSPNAASWSVQVAAADPRKFTDAVTGTTGLPSSSGGLTVPFTVPFTIASTVVSGEVDLTNVGNAPGPAVLRIDGPVVGPQITHVGSGLQVIFSASLTLGAGEFLLVDMEKQTALANGQASRNGWIVDRGWSAFEPGGNTWAFSAVSGAGQLTVTGTPSWQ